MTEETNAPEAAPPAKLSRLSLAVQAVTQNVTDIQALGDKIAEVAKKWPANTAFAVSTKEGMKEADDARKEARKLRLQVAGLRKDSTKLLNDLKTEAWAVADPEIERLQAIEDNAKAQIEAEQTKEATRKAALQEKVNAILRMAEGCGTWSSAQCAERMTEVASLNITRDDFQDFAEKATGAVLEVHSILTQARQAAQHREAEEAARAAREAELAALREKEERAARIKAKIDTMKALPAQAAGMGSAEIAVILRNHRGALPDAAHFGDQLEFAELVHGKVERELAELHAQAVAAEAAVMHAADDGAEVLIDTMAPLEPEGLAGDAPLDDERETRLPITTTRLVVEEDPLSAPIPQAAPAPRPVRSSIAERQWTEHKPAGIVGDFSDITVTPGVSRYEEQAPWVEALPEPLQEVFARPEERIAEKPAPILMDGPSLLQRASLVVEAFDRLPRNVTVEWTIDTAHDYIPDAASLAFTRAIADLRAAVDHFLSN